jgi:hypothetical protein
MLSGSRKKITINAVSYKVRQRVFTVQKKLHPKVLEHWSTGVLEKGKAQTSK